MATPNQKLASSLEVLRSLQDKGMVALRSHDLSRTHRERLVRNGFLKQIFRGWYLIGRPDEPDGESTTWYINFWHFCAAYFEDRFGKEYYLPAEHALQIHVGNMTVPLQLIVRSPKANNNSLDLLHGCSLLEVQSAMPDPGQVVEIEGLRMFSLPAGLVACSLAFFRHHPVEARVAVAMLRDASDVLGILLEGGHSTIAGRLAGAFRNIGRDRDADDVIRTMQAAGYDVREQDPFDAPAPLGTGMMMAQSPYVNRIRMMWDQMREVVIAQFPARLAPEAADVESYLQSIDEIYVTDAYHSLSIEGYRVSQDLIERVRSGQWDPDENPQDRQSRDALAARGYWQAYQAVRGSVRKVLEGANAGVVCAEDHRQWYLEMFGPEAEAGLIRKAELAGYRDGPVYIRRSKHVAPRYEAVRDCMTAFFDLLKHETTSVARIVLGHFVFVFIHPYMDGNGRMARFLMNVMMAAGGFPWTVVSVDWRAEYMDALEKASTEQDIAPFAQFLGSLVQAPGRPGQKA